MSQVTVIIPTHNRAEMLREALQSVLSQNCQDFDIVVSDNASTDHTNEVVAQFADQRIRYFRQTTNIGMTPNWKFAVAQANAEWIAMLADDDHYLPNHLEVGLQAMQRYPELTFHTCPAAFFGDSTTGENRPTAIVDRITPELIFQPRDAVRFLGIDHPGPMNSMICRKRDMLDVFWGPDGYIPQDLLIMTQLMIRGGFVFSNQITSRYRVHTAMASRAKQDTQKTLRFNVMVWYGVRYLCSLLLQKQICNLTKIEEHGKTATSARHVVPLVLGLASFKAEPQLRQAAARIFSARHDMDIHSLRFRLARRLGFWVLPWLERFAQQQVRWGNDL